MNHRTHSSVSRSIRNLSLVAVVAFSAHFPACHAAPEALEQKAGLEMARERLASGAYSDAIGITTAFLRSEPRNAEAHYLRGRARYVRYVDAYHRGAADQASDDFKLAIEDFSKALELLPELAEAYDYRGMCHAAMGRYDEALQDYNAALRYKPELVETYYGRAYLYERLERWPEALADYRKFLELSQDEYWRSRAKMRLRQIEGTINAAKKVERKPKPKASSKKVTRKRSKAAVKRRPLRKKAAKRAAPRRTRGGKQR